MVLLPLFHRFQLQRRISENGELSRPRAGEDPNAQLKMKFKQAFNTADSDTGKNHV